MPDALRSTAINSVPDALGPSALLLRHQDPRVLDAMLPYLTSYFGNPHSRTHAYGWESEKAVEDARAVRALPCLHVAEVHAVAHQPSLPMVSLPNLAQRAWPH